MFLRFKAYFQKELLTEKRSCGAVKTVMLTLTWITHETHKKK